MNFLSKYFKGKVEKLEEFVNEIDETALIPIEKLAEQRIKSLVRDGERHRFAEYLLSHCNVSSDAIKSALLEQKVTGERIGSILVRNGFITQSDLTKMILSFNPDRIASEKVANARIPVEILERMNIILSAETDDTIHVATMSDENEVKMIIKEYYPEKKLKFVPFMFDRLPDFIDSIKRSTVEMDEEDVPDDEMLDRIIRQAMKQKASDIHIEPHNGASYSVFFRKLGVREHVHEGDMEEYNTVITLLKDKARMDVAERRMGQDGGYQIEYGGKYVDLRVATVSTVEGEQAVVRILDPDRVRPNLDDLGIAHVSHWRKGISRQNGICLICGATGSGKTTTLNASLKEMDRFGKKIYTAEDPVEYRIPFVGQVSMNPQVGLTFAKSIKNFMRADPDVIVIGEVRDDETARNAVKGADTGHLILATLHTSSIISSLTRLRDLGVEPYELRYVLRAILVQTLVRTVCKACGGTGEYNGSVCQACGGGGYGGRTIVSECMSFADPEEVDKIISYTEKGALNQSFVAPWPEIVDDAVEKMLGGETTSDELQRVFGAAADDKMLKRGIDPVSFMLKKKKVDKIIL